MKSKVLFLTFDDGPSSEYTARFLDLLDRYDIKATFFTVGEFVRENRDIIRRMAADGHAVGIHSNSHVSAWRMSRRGFCEDMDLSIDALKELGITPKLYRPPWGHKRYFSEKEALARGLALIKWDVMAEDWKGSTKSDIIARKLRKRVFPGAVICLHDGRGKNDAPKRTLEALEIVIPEFLEGGYRFETLQ